MIDLNQLRYFVTVAETENVGKAAKLLNMTQSPLSRQIQDLETRLGLLLFERIRKRLYLTSAGKELLAEAKALLQHAETIETNAKARASGKIGTLEIGYVEGALNCGILPKILRNFKQQEPDISVRLSPKRSAEQFIALQENKIDIGFTYSKPSPTENFNCIQIYCESFLLASPEKSEAITFTKPKKLPLIAMPEKVSPQGISDLVNALHTINIDPDIQYEIADPTAVLDLVSAGIGHAILQESMQKRAPENITFQKLPKTFPLNLEIYLTTKSEQSPLTQRFWNNAKPSNAPPTTPTRHNTSQTSD